MKYTVGGYPYLLLTNGVAFAGIQFTFVVLI